MRTDTSVSYEYISELLKRLNAKFPGFLCVNHLAETQKELWFRGLKKYTFPEVEEAISHLVEKPSLMSLCKDIDERRRK